MKTHILTVIDESGSMGTKRHDVIAGFNEFLKDQKALPDEAVISLVKFNTNKSRVYVAQPVTDAPELSSDTYVPGGMTALYDAIAESVRLGDDEKADRVICVVITDGQENSSRETDFAQVKKIIADREAKGNWTFVYLGVNPEDWAKQTGTSINNMKAYDADKIGSQLRATSMAMCTMRSGDAMATVDFYAPANEASDAAKSLGSLGGKRGGPARAAKLSPDQRSEIARKASEARWSKNITPPED